VNPELQVQPELTSTPLEYKGQATAEHVTTVNEPLDWQVAVPEPEYPELQVTTTSVPVVPVIEFEVA